LVDTCGCGAVTDPQDPPAIRRAIQDLIADRDRLIAMGRRARECFRAQYCQERQEETLLRSHPIFAGGKEAPG
ncbi:MAG: group 1 glycosyl transferase, partial [Thermoplasmata archaeon]